MQFLLESPQKKWTYTPGCFCEVFFWRRRKISQVFYNGMTIDFWCVLKWIIKRISLKVCRTFPFRGKLISVSTISVTYFHKGIIQLCKFKYALKCTEVCFPSIPISFSCHLRYCRPFLPKEKPSPGKVLGDVGGEIVEFLLSLPYFPSVTPSHPLMDEEGKKKLKKE